MGSKQGLKAELTERLLLRALHEQDAATAARAAAERSEYLARVSRELALSLDEDATLETMAGVRLPRAGAWTIVDVVDGDGSIRRLPVSHPDPSKAALAKQLAQRWTTAGSTPATRAASDVPIMLSRQSGFTLLRAVHGEADLALLKRIGFAYLLLVPLVVRAQVHGAMIFVSPPGSSRFTPEETALAVDLTARCALALDNARLYRAADAMKVAAQRANKSKSEFLRSMSHELRTPLNAIGGFADIVALGIQGPVTDEQRKSLGRVKANQQHLLVLITEILDFTRIDSGGMSYENAKVVLPSALSAVADMLALAIKSAGLRVVGPEPDPTIVAWADHDRVRQILLNLVTNAVKYGASEGGTLRLRCARSDNVVSASVSDDGPGIPPEKLASIFDPYVQLTVGRAGRQGGVGLGLAISRDLAHGMNGELTVVSEVGRGTTFTLTLPRPHIAQPRGLLPRSRSAAPSAA
jgi:signal transduction histidine kinase